MIDEAVDQTGIATHRRRQLIKALRLPMPPGHRWTYKYPWRTLDCGTAGCACGLAFELGLSKTYRIFDVSKAIGLTDDQGFRIFAGGYGLFPSFLYKTWGYRVTPQMVADQLEKTL